MRARSLLAVAPGALVALAAGGAACSRSELYDELFDGLVHPDASALDDAGQDAADASVLEDAPAALSCANAVFDVCGTNMYQPGAPWPTYQRCSSHSGLSTAVGPTNPVIRWEIGSTGGESLTGPPSIGADGTIYVTGNGQLDAINPDGSRKWTATLTELDTGASTVAIGPDGTIFAALDRVYAVSPQGQKKWSSIPLSIPGDPAVFGSLGSSGSSVALGPCGTLFIGSGLGLLMLDQNGNEIWDHDGKGLTPAVQPKGMSFYGSVGGELFSVDPNGATLWTFVAAGEASTAGWIQPAPALAPDGTLYYAGTSGLYAIASDGTLRWEHAWGATGATSHAGSLASAALGADGTVYVAAPDSTLGALAPDGTLKWSLALPAVGTTPLIVDGDGVIFALGGSTLYAVLPSGKVEWSLIVDDSGEGALALGADGTLYLASAGVYAIGNAK